MLNIFSSVVLVTLWLIACSATDPGDESWGPPHGRADNHWTFHSKEFSKVCPEGEYIKAIEFWSGSLIDSIAVRCTNGAWSGFSGGSGGSRTTRYAEYGRFCGVRVRSSALFVHALCITDNKGEVKCGGGGHGLGDFNDDDFHCDRHDRRKVLIGIKGIAGRYVNQLQFKWKYVHCPQFYNLVGFPNSDLYSINGQYELVSYESGFPYYRRVASAADEKGIWHVTDGSRTNMMVGAWSFRFQEWGHVHTKSAQGRTCPHTMNGSPDLVQYVDGNWVQSHGRFLERTHLIGVYGKMVGYWVNDFTGNADGHSKKMSTSVTTSQGMSTERAKEEMTSATQHFETTHASSLETMASVNVGSVTAGAKWTTSTSRTEGQSNSYSVSVASAVKNSWSQAEQRTTQCTVTAPSSNGAEFVAWNYEVYRANRLSRNQGVTVSTCSYLFKVGLCKHVPPNCVPGACLNSECLECVAGVKPIQTIENLAMTYGNIVYECKQQEVLRCDPSKRQWDCCTKETPCGVGEGDCNTDDDCEGDLRCHNNRGGEYSTVVGMDVCGHSRGRLLAEAEAEAVFIPHLVEPLNPSCDGASAFPELVEVEIQTASHVDATGCHIFDDERDCTENGCVFFDDEDDLTLVDRLFVCWEDHECVFDEFGRANTCS